MAFDANGLSLPGLGGQEFGTPGNLLFATVGLFINIAEGNLLGIIIDVVEILIDVILMLIDLFSGVPLMEKTMVVSQRLMHGKNPAAYMWGNNIMRAAQGLGIPLSTSDPHERKIIDAFTHQFVFNMVQQGLTVAAAKAMAGHILSETQGPKQLLPAPLTVHLPSSFKLWGNDIIGQTYQQKYQALKAQGKTDAQANKLAFRHILQTLKLKDLVNVVISKEQPTTGNPPPPPPPPPPHQCPAGQHWDPALQKCVPDPPPPPPGDGTDLARNKILTRLADCICTIEQTLGAAAADDCLCRIAAAVEAIASTGSMDLTPLTAQVKRIADADNGYPVDSADARAKLKSLMDLAVKKYGFPADLGQLITG